MRELTLEEISLVAGAGDGCSSGGNVIAGVGDSATIGDDLVNIYEGLVATASHIIERVATSF
jgi:hypothetical protein